MIFNIFLEKRSILWLGTSFYEDSNDGSFIFFENSFYIFYEVIGTSGA